MGTVPFSARAVVLLTLVAGCGQRGPDLATVRGVVTFQGKPLANAEVMFAPRQGGRPATGRTDEQGRFQLTTFKEKDGALVGEHDVIVAKVVADPNASLPKAPPNNPAADVAPANRAPDPFFLPPRPPKWLIPARYGDAKTSGLSAKVTSGENQVAFDLLP